jgi:hypothetical protein
MSVLSEENINVQKLKKYLFVLLFSAVASVANAQAVAVDSLNGDSVASAEVRQGLLKRLNQKVTNSYYKLKYDTNYVVRPKEKWLVRLLGNYAGNRIHAKGTVNAVYSRYDLHTRRNTSIGLEVNYCDLAASLTLNPDKMSGTYDDYELNLEYHGNRFSADFNYLRSTSLSGDIRLGDIDHLDENGLRMNVVNVAGYYIFNYRKFSYSAALFQNYYQQRSAGSWLAGASFQGGSIKTTDELKARSPLAPEVHLTFVNVALGGGYGYNLVLGRKSQWLFHLSALPTVVVYKHNKLTVNDNDKRDHGLCLNMIFNERAAIVYHFTPRYNCGATIMMSNSIFDNDKVAVNQNKWLARAFVGVRF